MRRLSFILTVLVLVFTLSCVALADEGNVTYVGRSSDLIFEPGSSYSPTDLFPNFKDVMPGDVITQSITVKNDNPTRVRIYMRALGAHEGSEDFLSKLSMTVSRSDRGVSEYIFDATADATDGLTDWVSLGTFMPRTYVDLEVTLTVPTDLDNLYQDHVGYLDWEFMVEDLFDPVYPVTPKPKGIDITVTKVWKDADGKVIDAPEGVTVNAELFANGSSAGTVTLSSHNNWTHTFINKDKTTKQGKDIVYTVAEAFDSPDWETSVTGDIVNGFVITNTKKAETPDVPIEPTTVDVTVTKLWTDADGNPANAPQNTFVTVALFADGGSGRTVILNADNNWAYTFAKLPEYDASGNKINYTVAETTDDSRWIACISGDAENGFVITNMLTPKEEIEYTDITVTKVWKDTDGKVISAPNDTYVTVELVADGVPQTRSVLSDANSWTHTFTNLPATDSKGNEIVYSVTEYYDDEEWVSAVDGDAENGFTVTNTKKEKAPDTPQTGDNSKTGLWIAMASASFVLVIVFTVILICIAKKHDEEDEEQN